METQQGREGRPNDSPYSERVTRTIEFMKAMEYAEEEARLLNHDSIGTDDLVLGLMHDPLIKLALLKSDIQLDRVRESIKFIFGTDHKPHTEISLSPSAKKVIEVAGAGRFDFSVETPLIDLLRAIILEDKGRGAQILESLKINKDNLPQVINTYKNLKEMLAKKEIP